MAGYVVYIKKKTKTNNHALNAEQIIMLSH